MTRITYIISDIDKALAFEWITEKLNRSIFELSFILLLQRPSSLESYLEEQGITCFPIYYKSKKDFPFLLFKLTRLLLKINPKIVHCHLFNASILGLTAARICRVPHRFYTRHHSDFHHRYFPQGIKWDKWCNTNATVIVAPSLAVSTVLQEQEQVDATKIKLIPHGFDLEYFRNVPEDLIKTIRERYNPNNQKPVIGVISRFTELKGIQYIIPAFQKLLQQYPDALILFFNANGDYASSIKEMLRAIPECNYRLITFESNLSAVYRLFDVFIQVSIDTTIEAFGQTYIEALASGVPSVFTLSGIATDFVKDEENALVVPFKNSEAIYKAMKRILNGKELREKLKSEGWNSVKERFALHHMIKQLECLYAE